MDSERIQRYYNGMNMLGGANRAKFLQDEIVKAIIYAVEEKHLPADWVRSMFGKALKDETINQILYNHWKDGAYDYNYHILSRD